MIVKKGWVKLNGQTQPSVEYVSNFEGYFYQVASTLVGKQIAVQTTRSTIQGTLSNVTPDHIVVLVSKVPFYIRNQEIVWVTQSIK